MKVKWSNQKKVYVMSVVFLVNMFLLTAHFCAINNNVPNYSSFGIFALPVVMVANLVIMESIFNSKG